MYLLDFTESFIDHIRPIYVRYVSGKSQEMIANATAFET